MDACIGLCDMPTCGSLEEPNVDLECSGTDAVCGDGVWQSCEGCDTELIEDWTCELFDYAPGTMDCAGCKVNDVSGCPPPCTGPTECVALGPLADRAGGGHLHVFFDMNVAHDRVAVAWRRGHPGWDTRTAIRLRVLSADLVPLRDACVDIPNTEVMALAAVRGGWVLAARTVAPAEHTVVPIDLDGVVGAPRRYEGGLRLISNERGDALSLGGGAVATVDENGRAGPFVDVGPSGTFPLAGVATDDGFLVVSTDLELLFVGRVAPDGSPGDFYPTSGIMDWPSSKVGLVWHPDRTATMTWIRGADDRSRTLWHTRVDALGREIGAAREVRGLVGPVGQAAPATLGNTPFVAVGNGSADWVQRHVLVRLGPGDPTWETVNLPVSYLAMGLGIANGRALIGWVESGYPQRISLGAVPIE